MSKLLTPEARMVRKDFYLSFLHSQGNPEAQQYHFEFMHRFYSRVLGGSYADVLPPDHSWLIFDKLPRSHTRSLNSLVKVISEQRAADFYCWVTGSDIPQDEISVLRSIADLSIEKDTFYQRSNRTISSDPHSSFYREHGLKKNSTGSTVLDAMYAAASGSGYTDLFPDEYHRLAREWKNNHPSEIFDETLAHI